MNIRVAFKTDVGQVREHNEDNFLVLPDLSNPALTYSADPVSVSPHGALFAVADGMGGTNAGEVASLLAIQAIEAILQSAEKSPFPDHTDIPQRIQQAFQHAQSLILDHVVKHPQTEGMGTTLIVGVIEGGLLHLAWLGDSRCYLFRKDGILYHLSKDHSYVQNLIDKGDITSEQAFYHPDSNIITRSLGDADGRNIVPEYATYVLREGDRLLFCSDGLNGMLRDHDIASLLSTESDVRVCTDRCIQMANENGGHDNITVVIVDVLSVGDSEIMQLAESAPLRIAYSPVLPTSVSFTDTQPSFTAPGSHEPSWFQKPVQLGIVLSIVASVLVTAGFITGMSVNGGQDGNGIPLDKPSLPKGNKNGDSGKQNPLHRESDSNGTRQGLEQEKVPLPDDANADPVEAVNPKKDTRGKPDSIPKKKKDTVHSILTPIETI